MSYRSFYRLNILNASPAAEEAIIKDLRNTNESAEELLTEYGSSEVDGYWREMEKEMRAFSILHAGVLFEIEEEHQDAEDTKALHMFRDGKYLLRNGYIVYDPLPGLDFEEKGNITYQEMMKIIITALESAKKAIDLNDHFGTDIDARHKEEEQAVYEINAALSLLK